MSMTEQCLNKNFSLVFLTSIKISISLTTINCISYDTPISRLAFGNRQLLKIGHEWLAQHERLATSHGSGTAE